MDSFLAEHFQIVSTLKEKQIRFSNSDEDEEKSESAIQPGPTKNLIASLLLSETNKKAKQNFNGVHFIPSSSTNQISTPILQKSVSNNILDLTKEKLKSIQKEQITLKDMFVKVHRREDFLDARKRFLDQQTRLSFVNKELSKVKKEIKDFRESQIDYSQSSQASDNDKGLVKRAKELISQQKFLVHLLKIQKEFGDKIKGFRCTEKASTAAASSLINNEISRKQNEKEHHLVKASTKKTILKSLIDRKLVEPGKNVFSIFIKGTTKHASLQDDALIQSNKGGIFSSLEEWLKKESQMVFSKNVVFSMVKYNGVPISTIIKKAKENQTSTKGSFKSIMADVAKNQNSIHLNCDTSFDQSLASGENTQLLSNNSATPKTVSVKKHNEIDTKHQEKDFTLTTRAPLTKTVRLWSQDEFCNAYDFLPEDFWRVGFQDVELYEKLMN